jgi:hypothetical protein
MPRAAHGTVRGRRLRPAVAEVGVRVAPVMVGSAPATAAALAAGLPRPLHILKGGIPWHACDSCC